MLRSPPSNQTTALASALGSKLGDVLDINFHLAWNFGVFLRQIPIRLGMSASLDAASDVLVAAHTPYCLGRFDPDPTVLKKHSRALLILRNDLNDVIKARTSETLSAVMILMIAQVRSFQARLMSKVLNFRRSLLILRRVPSATPKALHGCSKAEDLLVHGTILRVSCS